MNIFNFDTKKVGGIRFIKLGRFTLSFCVSSAYRPIGVPAAWCNDDVTLAVDGDR